MIPQRPFDFFWADKGESKPTAAEPWHFTGGGTPGGEPPESDGGGNRGESRRHSHSLLTPVGSADCDFLFEKLMVGRNRALFSNKGRP